MQETIYPGVLIISLDFELYWGVRDKKTINEYKENLLGARIVIPKLLELFNQYDIHATWATVGFLFHDNFEELINSLPPLKPRYNNTSLNPYYEMEQIGRNESEDPYHYALSLIKKINSFKNQEIATHTYSHYYCMEDGQDLDSFESDLRAAINIGKKNNIQIESLIFPRNQYKPEYLEIAKKNGITSFRGNRKSWIYRSRKESEYSLGHKMLRFLDSNINISGHNCHSLAEIGADYPFNIPASQFLYPYNSKLRAFDRMKLNRICSDMQYAAMNNEVYHLWWHPHNFGINTQQNLDILTKILECFRYLKKDYGMESFTMQQLATKIMRDYV